MGMISINPYRASFTRQPDTLQFGRDENQQYNWGDPRANCFDLQHRGPNRARGSSEDADRLDAAEQPKTTNKDKRLRLWKATDLHGKLEEHLHSLSNWARNPLQADLAQVEQEVTGLHQDLLAYIQATNQSDTFRALQKQLETEDRVHLAKAKEKYLKLSPKLLVEALIDQVNQVMIGEPLTSYRMICQMALTLVPAIKQSQQEARQAEKLRLAQEREERKEAAKKKQEEAAAKRVEIAEQKGDSVVNRDDRIGPVKQRKKRYRDDKDPNKVQLIPGKLRQQPDRRQTI